MDHGQALRLPKQSFQLAPDQGVMRQSRMLQSWLEPARRIQPLVSLAWWQSFQQAEEEARLLHGFAFQPMFDGARGPSGQLAKRLRPEGAARRPGELVLQLP